MAQSIENYKSSFYSARAIANLFDELVLGKEKEMESPCTIVTTLSVDVKDYNILGVATSSGQRAKESSTRTHGSQPGREPFHDNPFGNEHTQLKDNHLHLQM